MEFFKKKEFWIFALITLGTIASYFWFKDTNLFSILLQWSKENFVLFFTFLILYKFLSIAYPPLVGGVVMLASIPFVGWQYAFTADLIGSTFGGIFNYYIGRRYGLKFIKNIFGKEITEKIRKVKIKKNKEMESIIVVRILTGSMLVEILHYASGVLKVSFNRYFWAMLISHFIIGIPVFYTAGEIFAGRNILWLAALILIFIPLLYKFRGRYLDNI